ncbi:MAG: sugar transporter [Betaproteobacteria bacterium]|nr:sugar transporter [Betaproteobacteria bacterium]MCC7216367.1 hypothetical protein [Burkholderiales bacterium]
MLRQFRLAAVLAASLACAGCGIKGPLMLPPASPAAAVPAPAVPPPAGAPATPPAGEQAPATPRKQ